MSSKTRQFIDSFAKPGKREEEIQRFKTVKDLIEANKAKEMALLGMNIYDDNPDFVEEKKGNYEVYLVKLLKNSQQLYLIQMAQRLLDNAIQR